MASEITLSSMKRSNGEEVVIAPSRKSYAMDNKDEKKMRSRQGMKFGVVVALVEAALIIAFAFVVRYGEDADPKAPPPGNEERLNRTYGMFQDVHVMIFIGFGFLMTFLKRYGYSAVGVNMLLAAIVIQWATLCNNFWSMDAGKIYLDINTILGADFTAAAILITFGVVLGRTSPLQLVVMVVIETFIYAVNEHIGRHYLHAVDMGDSIFVHTFGAYFGLALSGALFRRELEEASAKAESVYRSDLFSMIGTVFLWIFWPSFNAAGAAGDERYRAILNTYFSISACCVITFAISALVDKRGRFSMEHIQNATLAGGVAIGASGDMMVHPYGALIVGTVAGIVSTIGFKYLTPTLATKLKVYDTCGVNNLHGMPGIMAAIISIIMAALADTDTYGNSLYDVFPAMAPKNTTGPPFNGTITEGEGFSAGRMAAAQASALGVTLGMAIVGGALTGLLLRLPIFDEPRKVHAIYDDEMFWNVAEGDGHSDDDQERRNFLPITEQQRL